MIVVTVEIWPHGDPKQVEVIGILQIVNTLKSPKRPKWGDYQVWESIRAKKFELKSHDRSRGIWPLIKRAAMVLEKKDG